MNKILGLSFIILTLVSLTACESVTVSDSNFGHCLAVRQEMINQQAKLKHPNKGTPQPETLRQLTKEYSNLDCANQLGFNGHQKAMPQ